MNRFLVFFLGLTLLVSSGHAAKGMNAYEQPRVAPSFELPSIKGDAQRLSDFQGKYVLVNFWAVWCAPCRKEMPSMQRVYRQLAGERFDLVAIHAGPSVANAKQYAEKLGLEFPVLVDVEMDLGSWQVQGLPTTFLVDPEGQIVAEAIGERDWDDPVLLAWLKQQIDTP